jgi:mitogen-activated protein kinase 1/3
MLGSLTSSSAAATQSSRVFNLPFGYTGLKVIGTGAYGVVVSAKDPTGHTVAVKRIPKWTSDVIDGKRILREVKLLRFLSGHENILKLYAVESSDSLDDVYIVTELRETDLHKIVYSRALISNPHRQWFLYQMLRGMKYLQSAGIIHRDLKPSNILLNANCDLCLADFGLARGVSINDNRSLGVSSCPPGGERELQLTEYVVTRWYRAPELLLGQTAYTSAVDVFSLGCIFAELFRRKPLVAGKDYQDQLRLLTHILGVPSEDELKAFVTNEKALQYMRKLRSSTPLQSKADWNTVLKMTAPDEALDLLSKMLTWSPEKRITIEQALQHPFVRHLSESQDEPVSTMPFDYSFEKLLGSKEDGKDVLTLKNLMRAEIELFKQEQKSKLTLT